jgi:hypothetical protein
MVGMIESRRQEREREQPVLWRKSARSAALTRTYFTALLFAPRTIMLVAAAGQSIGGFLIARGVPAPPVYAVRGRTALIDDFTVARALWADVRIHPRPPTRVVSAAERSRRFWLTEQAPTAPGARQASVLEVRF